MKKRLLWLWDHVKYWHMSALAIAFTAATWVFLFRGEINAAVICLTITVVIVWEIQRTI